LAGLAEHYWVFCLATSLVLGIDGMFNVYIRTKRVEIIPPQDFGKPTGLAIVFTNITLPISGLLVTALSPYLEVREIILTLSVSSLSLGALVAIIEKGPLGGTCVNVGCVPKKLFVYASSYSRDFSDAVAYGWSPHDQQFDWNKLRDNKNKEILRLNEIYNDLLKNAGVKLIRGLALIISEHSVQVGDEILTCEKMLLAPGGKPFVPDFPGKEHVVTSNEIFFLPQLPKKALIVGGGYISVEFASIFQGLGVETTQIYRGELFLRGFDEDIRTSLAEEMSKKGLNLRFNSNIAKVEKSAQGYIATLEDGSQIETDLILYATGRVPNVASLGLEKVGVKLGKSGAIIVNDEFQTNVPSIYALGDVIGKVQLTPVAIAEGMALSRNLFNGESFKVDYEYIPTAVFSQPAIGTVGLTENEAKEKYGKVKTYLSKFRSMKFVMPDNQERSLMKLIVDEESDRVVGLHMLGPDAGEITQGFAVALKAGATKKQFDETLGIHPTLAEEFVTMR